MDVDNRRNLQSVYVAAILRMFWHVNVACASLLAVFRHSSLTDLFCTPDDYSPPPPLPERAPMHEQLPYTPPPEKGDNDWEGKRGGETGMGGGQGGAGFRLAPPATSAVIFGSDAQVSWT